MPDFHVELVLEWFQTQSSKDRTEATLASIATHVGTTYALSAEEMVNLQTQARTRAHQRHLLMGE